MTQILKIVPGLIFCLFTLTARADSWTDPSWKQMLDSSDVIALVDYTSNGDFRASARIITVYKGELKPGDEIWISGFSNRYGPIDKMNKGDRYLVFLNLSEPTDKRVGYWAGELKKDAKIKGFVDAFKNRKAFYVWSPTSGDLKVKNKKIQYDLTGTSYYSKQPYYPLEEFEIFLKAYINDPIKNNFCRELIAKIKPATESDLSAQHLMKLFLLGYNEYDAVFENYARVNNTSSKYALAQLMGNIKTQPSREILITLLDDKESIVQGEVVRQLKNEPAEIVAPILLKHLNTSSEANFGPSNIMDPVLNRIDGGKVEIIQALGELKYRPAIPALLSLLETKDDYLFGLTIESLKQIGSKEYITYINRHLDNKTDDLIFKISMMIAKDSLVECLPSFKNFISTCNRNKHPSYEYTLSTCCGIGNFRDSSTVSFLLSDYEKFFSYKDSLESSKQNEWTKEYIETFTDLKLNEARPLIYRSLYDWFGLNQDFGKSPGLFETKKQLEDSVRKTFTTRLGKKGYKINYCIAFIQNTGEVITGSNPTVNYLIEATIPSTERGSEYKEIIMKELNLPGESIYIRYTNGWYDTEKQDRFDKSISSTPLGKFIDFARVVPNQSDLNFLKGLLDNSFIKDDYYEKEIKETIEEIKTKLTR